MFDIFVDNSEQKSYSWKMELYATRFIIESKKFREKRVCKRFVKEIENNFLEYKRDKTYCFGLVVI